MHVEVPVPSPKKDEVLLKLEAASLNPVDWKTQKGNLRPLFPPRFPFIPVTDVAGEVIEVGSAVKSFKAGDKVVSMLIFMKGGGLAEYAVASSSLTVHRPAEVSPAEGAGLPIAASTALQALKSAGAKFDGSAKPLNILITAASGGVGHYAVQLAKLANLHVTATCGARNIDLVKSLGADEVLDYKSRDGEILRSPSGKKYDAVIQCSTGVEWSVFEPNLSENGKVVVVTPNPMTFVKSAMKMLTCAKKKTVPMVLMPKEEDLKFLVGLVKEEKLKTVVDSRHLLSNAEDGWAKCMDGHATGKIIIEM
ncbi:chloroplast envelope quinone oxidoreductase homolog [Dendrobium catenatum]|uniref:chloroplast envelope quinone oxidoreductase homolog n=1 Tax=Dendrobium catenatum TaxID=906689 RepID=UPI0010A0607E|nr:chloroplast envelope quinone oxidoreductase homolog [Dendrobium catenatum]